MKAGKCTPRDLSISMTFQAHHADQVGNFSLHGVSRPPGATGTEPSSGVNPGRESMDNIGLVAVEPAEDSMIHVITVPLSFQFALSSIVPAACQQEYRTVPCRKLPPASFETRQSPFPRLVRTKLYSPAACAHRPSLLDTGSRRCAWPRHFPPSHCRATMLLH